jgi:transcriptional regulator with XRE-family HTH domain
MAPHAHNAHMATTGLDLKLRRVAAGISGKAIAEAMGVSPGRVSKIEKPEPVTLDMEARYVAALSKCVTKSTRIAA